MSSERLGSQLLRAFEGVERQRRVPFGLAFFAEDAALQALRRGTVGSRVRCTATRREARAQTSATGRDVPCCMRNAPCCMRHALCCMCRAACWMRHVYSNIPRTMCSGRMRHAPCHHAPGAMLHAPCVLKYTMHHVLWLRTPCAMPPCTTCHAAYTMLDADWHMHASGWRLPQPQPLAST